jgi:hypothetical protein
MRSCPITDPTHTKSEVGNLMRLRRCDFTDLGGHFNSVRMAQNRSPFDVFHPSELKSSDDQSMPLPRKLLNEKKGFDAG